MLVVVPFVLSLAASAAAAIVPVEKRQGTPYAWCDVLAFSCDDQIQNFDTYEDFFAHDTCLFGSTCPPDALGPANGTFPERRSVQLFLNTVVRLKQPKWRSMFTLDLRVPTSILRQISTDGKTVTEQNFIDGFYHAIDYSGGPYPENVSYVKDHWTYIADWTAVCSGGIPFKNFADFFVYSSYVKSEGNCH